MRFGFSWPIGGGRRMWLSGGIIYWLFFGAWLLAALIVGKVLELIVRGIIVTVRSAIEVGRSFRKRN